MPNTASSLPSTHDLHTKILSLNNNVNSTISIFYLNIRSLRKNFNSLLAEISQILDSIDILILVETNICDEEICLYSLPNFNGEFINRENRRGGGIAAFINKRLNFETTTLNFNSFDSLKINLKLQDSTLPVVCLYRPPTTYNTSTFSQELENLLSTFPLKNDIVAIGDFNIDICKETSYVEEYLDMMSSIELLNCNQHETTRKDLIRGTDSNIDHIFLRPKHINETVYENSI